jgi:F-type H+-transporting ATPase subunit c
METLGLVAIFSIVSSACCIMVGGLGPAFGESKVAAQALQSMAQQPDESNNITRTLFISMAMVESTAIYCFVVTMILIFANPFWNAIKDATLK